MHIGAFQVAFSMDNTKAIPSVEFQIERSIDIGGSKYIAIGFSPTGKMVNEIIQVHEKYYLISLFKFPASVTACIYDAGSNGMISTILTYNPSYSNNRISNTALVWAKLKKIYISNLIIYR